MAVEIRLSAAEVARVRFAVSPLAETVLGVRAALGAGGHDVHRPWVREAREVLAGEPELGLLRALLEGCLPSFLFPAPGERLPAFEAELAAVRTAEAAYVAAECTAALGPRARGLPAPAALTERVADALARCHERLVAPHWGRMRAVLEADLGRRAVALVDGGVEGLFAQLHGDVVWREGEPLSTPALADRLGVTPGAVSQHLGALRGAGLVATRRCGRTALHLRTRTGTLLTAGADGVDGVDGGADGVDGSVD
ncbi:helix-turn-helix domain-containing protein [Kitasatospora sp. NPDC048538]|uniref:helix-turn-helix domain-containing protein n=1 Tax=unclassified Kitasatospora TaxID=2633591 RepID=UPI0033C5B4D1